jgi:hypothetical protein
MARPIRQTFNLGATGTLLPVILNNLNGSPFNVNCGVDLSAGATLTYTVEYTLDDVFSPTFNPATATWYSTTGLTALSADAAGGITVPVTAVRLNVTAWTSGTAVFTVIQTG